ncbi:hypothetical protein Tco_0142840, partial [Tanacetum coccineum]
MRHEDSDSIKPLPLETKSGPSNIGVTPLVVKGMGNSLVRAATTASSLEAEQDSGGGPRKPWGILLLEL